MHYGSEYKTVEDNLMVPNEIYSCNDDISTARAQTTTGQATTAETEGQKVKKHAQRSARF